MKLLVLNGSPHGEKGNCGQLIKNLTQRLGDTHSETVHLARHSFSKSLEQKIKKADALLLVTGTYWDSWGSPLQKFLEMATELEAVPAIVGKPAGVVVLMHSVGGKGVLSRLQGVLSTFGFLIPPFTGMTYSLAGQIAASGKSAHGDDFWSLEDLDIIIENLKVASDLPKTWQAWPVDRKNFRKTWIKK